jgi:hypothetical protein
MIWVIVYKNAFSSLGIHIGAHPDSSKHAVEHFYEKSILAVLIFHS